VVQAPGAEILKDESRWNLELKPYVIGVISHFHDDRRVLIWDLMNEPIMKTVPTKPRSFPTKPKGRCAYSGKNGFGPGAPNPPTLTSAYGEAIGSSDDKLSEMASLQLQTPT